MKYKFYPQIGKKPKLKGIGTLCIDNGLAMFFEGNADWNDMILSRLDKAEVIFISSLGVKVKGFEHIGNEKDGRKKYKYMEWWCPFVEEKI